jgi:hypothetical protein
MFKKKKKCLICRGELILYKNYFFTDICKKCFNNITNIRFYRKLNINSDKFAIFQNNQLINYKEPIEFVHFVLPHPFGNIIRTVEFNYRGFKLKIELSQEHICYKRNRIINITDNIILYKDIYILNKTYEDIFNEVIYYKYYHADSLFIQIFDDPDVFFKNIDIYKIYLINSNIKLVRLYDSGKNKQILQNYADKFDEYYPFCTGQIL